MENSPSDYPSDETKSLARERCQSAKWQNFYLTPKECIDGRTDHEIFGVPGGDAGLLVATIATYEKMTGRPLDKKQIIAVLDKYIDLIAHNNFYFHTDNHAHELPDNQEAQTDNIGCGHLKEVLKNPEKYQTRKEITGAILTELYTRAKQTPSQKKSNPIKLTTLTSNHDEIAVIIIENTDNDQAPAIKPNLNGQKMFVYHAGVAKEIIKKIADNAPDLFKANSTTKFEYKKIDEFESQLTELFNQQTMATVEELAINKNTQQPLPIYKVSITRDKQNNNQINF
ncbi:MAG: hypothetical protein COU31_05160 [Candidatus Magasanikbacteria bacterium CG10_big_fil_rev_8_21_14_0_10_40_10]|uniref:Uncharacterized protein n=1 Tax=Candidatus Magasanikbacteria bacterium CG10_big_fil_rev_8_21_14_0_10_40_10 TaxID=1974648 RepID=A0A2M6W2T7_9BACT|nr:MAG: hypothetical protein COU31_05160 [Candidatus Magasanikbacteria bacterium CG10_big_fil_rev_8_21_14_0_10_40_10]